MCLTMPGILQKSNPLERMLKGVFNGVEIGIYAALKLTLNTIFEK